MATMQGDTPGPPTEEQSLEERIESALTEYHVVDPRRLEEVDQMRAEMLALVEQGDQGGAERLAKLCLDYIRAGQAIKE